MKKIIAVALIAVLAIAGIVAGVPALRQLVEESRHQTAAEASTTDGTKEDVTDSTATPEPTSTPEPTPEPIHVNPHIDGINIYANSEIEAAGLLSGKTEDEIIQLSVVTVSSDNNPGMTYRGHMRVRPNDKMVRTVHSIVGEEGCMKVHNLLRANEHVLVLNEYDKADTEDGTTTKVKGIDDGSFSSKVFCSEHSALRSEWVSSCGYLNSTINIDGTLKTTDPTLCMAAWLCEVAPTVYQIRIAVCDDGSPKAEDPDQPGGGDPVVTATPTPGTTPTQGTTPTPTPGTTPTPGKPEYSTPVPSSEVYPTATPKPEGGNPSYSTPVPAEDVYGPTKVPSGEKDPIEKETQKPQQVAPGDDPIDRGDSSYSEPEKLSPNEKDPIDRGGSSYSEPLDPNESDPIERTSTSSSKDDDDPIQRTSSTSSTSTKVSSSGSGSSSSGSSSKSSSGSGSSSSSSSKKSSSSSSKKSSSGSSSKSSSGSGSSSSGSSQKSSSGSGSSSSGSSQKSSSGSGSSSSSYSPEVDPYA